MAVCHTIRTKEGISSFLLPSENGNEYVTAFKYDNNKVEVHSLKKECAPLYLEEHTSVNILSNESFTALLVAVTPNVTTSCLDIRLWDVASAHGFTPKDIHLKVEYKKEGKFRCTYDVQKVLKEELTHHIVATYGALMCLILNGKYCILMKAKKNDLGVISFDVKTSFLLSDTSNVTDVLFLNEKQKTYLVLAEGCNVNIMHVDDDGLTPTHVLTVPMKRSKGTAISRLHKLTCSKCFVIDDVGHLSLLCVPNMITPLKFPSTVGGHGICSIVGFKHTSEGMLAICNNEYTINIYSLADILCSVTNSCNVKPHRALCSQFPINSLTFVRSDQLAMASTVNQSITFWGGFSSIYNT